MIYRLGFFGNGRTNISEFLQQSYSTGKGVEVGTHRGEFAAQIMEKWKGTLYCVDPYLHEYNPRDPAAMSNRPKDERIAKKKLQGKNVVFIPTTSEFASFEFPDECLDWAYIDGDHFQESVALDLNCWYPKIRKGGYLLGHDILTYEEKGSPGDWNSEIQPALQKFCEEKGIEDVFLIREDYPCPWSFYIQKE